MTRSTLGLAALTLLFGAQSLRVLNGWGARPQTVLVGDMNAVPGSREIRMILDAGFVDAGFRSGLKDRSRIDWIFHTPDLMAHEVTVVESRASDHPAFVATISRRQPTRIR